MESLKKNISIRRIIIFLILAEICSLSVLLIVFIKNKDKQFYSEITGSLHRSEIGYFLSNHEIVHEKSTPVLESNYHHLPAGTYTGIIEYQIHDVQKISFSASQKQFIKANSVILDPNQYRSVFYVLLTQPVDDFQIIVNHEGDGNILIRKIDLLYAKTGYIRNAVLIIFIFSIVEIGIFLWKKKHDLFLSALFFSVISLISFLPYSLDGIILGHDFYFHFMRIEGLANEIRNGQIPVYMQSLWLSGFGSPVSMYYGDALLYFPALLRVLGFSFTESYKIFVFIITFMTAVFSYIAYYELFSNKTLSRVCSLAYVCAPYRFIQIYVRNAVGEYTAAAFLPLAFVGYYCLISQKQIALSERGILNFTGYHKYILMTAAGLAGILTSHILSAEMTAFLLVLITLVNLKNVLNVERIKNLFATGILTLLLSAFFIVPFIDSFLSNDTVIRNQIETQLPAIQNAGMQFGELFAFFKDIFGAGSAPYNDRLYLSIGITLVGAVVLSFYHIIKKNLSDRLKMFFGMTVFCLWLSSNLFPWNMLTNYSKIGRILSSIQFPWRFLIFATLFAVLTLGESISMINNDDYNPIFADFSQKKYYLIICIMVLLDTSLIVSNYASSTSRKIIYNTNDFSFRSFEPKEYKRSKTDIYSLNYDIHSDSATITDIKRKGTTIQFEVDNDHRSESAISVPIFNYKGYHVTDQNGTPFDISDGENDTISFKVPAGFSGTICVYFEPFWYWKLAFFISSFYSIVIAVWIMHPSRRRIIIKIMS